MDDTEGDDIPSRIELVASVLSIAKGHDKVQQSAADTLKVFMMPEFFFRGKKGAYTMEQVQAVIKGLQDTVKGSEWKNWFFVFGTTLGYSYSGAVDPLVDPQQDAEVYNFVLCQQGGFGDDPNAGPEAARTVMKEELSGIDFVRLPTSKGGMPAPDDYQAFLLERVKHLDAAGTRGTSSEVSVKHYGGEGIFDACGLTWGVEVCLDHDKSVHRLKSSTNLPNLNFQLVPSCGMSIVDESIVVKTGYVFHVDGLNDDGQAPNTNKNAHSELRKVKMSTSTNVPVDPMASVTLDSQIDVTNLYAEGAGDLHIYDVLLVDPA
jgi:hypothetical protein